MLGEIEEFDFGEGDRAYAVELPIPPFGSARFAAADTSTDSRRILMNLIGSWDELWPDMRELLVERMESSAVEQKLGVHEFVGSLSRMEPDCYMEDRSDLFLRLEFEEPPLWDFFLKGRQIVHFQPGF